MAMSHLEQTIPSILAGALTLSLAACTQDSNSVGMFTSDASSGSGISGSGEAGEDATGDSTGGSGESSGVKLDIGDSTGGDATAGDGGSGAGCQSIDVLFIVDISASMGEEKDNLELNFPNFVQVLDDYIADPMSGATSYRIGVTNSSFVQNAEGMSSFGLDGALYDGEANFGGSCGLGGVPWIDGPAPDVTTKFACIGRQPKSPCSSCTDIGKERPLDAIEGFVDKAAPGGVNDGFFRGENSLLVVVILTDEDDDANNSTTTPAQTKAALDAFASGEDRYVVVTIAGPESTSCDSAFGSADAAPTLHAFTNMVPNGYLGDICLGDLSTSLSEALALIQTSCDTFPPVG